MKHMAGAREEMFPERQGENIALEVLRNGSRLCTAGLNGAPGVITAIVDCVDRGRRTAVSLNVSGLESSRNEEHILWSLQPLRVGDEVVIRIAENARPTRVRARYKLASKSREDQERAWLRKTAKKHGYKLVKL